MHMADALVSPPVAATAALGAAALLVTALVRVRRAERADSLALTGVMGAFIFVAQMLNFSIPGTGSSGHIVGGILLAALLGPWAAFLTLACVLIIQCLLFADGGLMALGCNLINMGAMTCLVAYPLVYKPIIDWGSRRGSSDDLRANRAGIINTDSKRGVTPGRITLASVAACVVGLELGALLVAVETELSGVTALPLRDFLLLMLPIHLCIGAIEGIATAAVLTFVWKSRPELLNRGAANSRSGDEAFAKSSASTTGKPHRLILVFAAAVVILGACAAGIASSNPDGLEWSIARLTGDTELRTDADRYAATPARQTSEALQSHTALLPDYDNRFSGLVGAALVVVIAGGIAYLCRQKKTV